jgi:hypothetical protein
VLESVNLSTPAIEPSRDAGRQFTVLLDVGGQECLCGGNILGQPAFIWRLELRSSAGVLHPAHQMLLLLPQDTTNGYIIQTRDR